MADHETFAVLPWRNRTLGSPLSRRLWMNNLWYNADHLATLGEALLWEWYTLSGLSHLRIVSLLDRSCTSLRIPIYEPDYPVVPVLAVPVPYTELTEEWLQAVIGQRGFWRGSPKQRGRSVGSPQQLLESGRFRRPGRSRPPGGRAPLPAGNYS